MNPPNYPVLIIGVGNPYCGDDGAGIAAVRRLVGSLPAGVIIKEENGEGTALAEAWKGAEFVFVVDAMQSGAPVGTVRRIDAAVERIPKEVFSGSTHAFGVAGAIELARTLNDLPPRLILFAIEGRNFAAGDKLSPPVEESIETVAQLILAEAQEVLGNDIRA
jgi:hydrogenase maturation protease